MTRGARTPEELETLLEDAIIVRDRVALALLFENAAVLDAGLPAGEARGQAEIAAAASSIWERERTWVAGARLVIQAGDTVLSLGRGARVLRRGPDRAWRFAIAVLDHRDPEGTKEE